jgi:C4-dicarboxylate-specific signal transduction histidine kinase
MLLKVEPPDLAQINEILSDIVWDEQRAGEIILGLRNLLNNRTEADLRPSDVNDTIRDVVRIVSPEVAGRGVVLRTVLASEALLVRSDPIHLQQAIINLVMNGMEAMEEARRTI